MEPQMEKKPKVVTPMAHRILTREVQGKGVFDLPHSLAAHEDHVKIKLSEIVDDAGDMNRCIFLGFSRDGNYLYSYKLGGDMAIYLQLWRVAANHKSKLIWSYRLFEGYFLFNIGRSTSQLYEAVKLLIYESSDSKLIVVHGKYQDENNPPTREDPRFNVHTIILPGPAVDSSEIQHIAVPIFQSSHERTHSFPPSVIEIEEGDEYSSCTIAVSVLDEGVASYVHCKLQYDADPSNQGPGWMNTMQYKAMRGDRSYTVTAATSNMPAIENQSFQFDEDFDFHAFLKKACWTASPSVIKQGRRNNEDADDSDKDDDDDDMDECALFMDKDDLTNNIDIDNKTIRNVWLTSSAPSALHSFETIRWRGLQNKSRHLLSPSTFPTMLLRFPARSVDISAMVDTTIDESFDTDGIFSVGYEVKHHVFGNQSYSNRTVPALPTTLRSLPGQLGSMMSIEGHLAHIAIGTFEEEDEKHFEIAVFMSAETGLSYCEYEFNKKDGDVDVKDTHAGEMLYMGCASPVGNGEKYEYSPLGVGTLMNDCYLPTSNADAACVAHAWLPIELVGSPTPQDLRIVDESDGSDSNGWGSDWGSDGWYTE